MSQTKAALMYDAVELIARGLHALDTSQFQQQRIDLKSLNCKKETTWGPTVLEAIRKVSFVTHSLKSILRENKP